MTLHVKRKMQIFFVQLIFFSECERGESMETICEDGKPMMPARKIRKKRGHRGYLWEMPWPKGNLYLAVRKLLGLSQEKFAAHTDMTHDQVRYRERRKRQYAVSEILFLKEISGLDWEGFEELMERCA